MAEVHAALPSPGVGARRKGPKSLPTLPLSAFTPPNTGASDRFPRPPSPSTVHPEKVVDAHVAVLDGRLTQWKSEVAQVMGDRVDGIALSLQGNDANQVQKAVETILGSDTSDVQIISVLVPYPLEDGVPLDAPSYLASSSKIPIHLTTRYTKPSSEHAEGIKWALQKGHVVDVDVQADIANGEAGWEGLEELLDKALGTPQERKGTIVLSNILPPPHSLTLPIVKLLTHPTYRAYQDRLATLSLFPNVYVKFLPPMWDAPTPSTPIRGTLRVGEGDAKDSKEKKEWKRRIKMYLGPAVEAFGYQRIIFGSSPSPSSKSASSAGDWYELARESLTELGVEQADIDAVFCENAKNVYGSP